MLINKRDAVAQYEAVKEAYTQAQVKAQYEAIVQKGGTPVAILDENGKVIGYKEQQQFSGVNSTNVERLSVNYNNKFTNSANSNNAKGASSNKELPSTGENAGNAFAIYGGLLLAGASALLKRKRQ